MVKRIRCSTILEHLKDNFIEDCGYDKDVILKEVRTRMDNYPDETFVCVGYNDEKIVAFLIAWQLREYAWLDQTWSIDKEASKEGMELFESWCRGKKLLKIRAETERSQKVLERVWGFKPHSVIMEKMI